MAASDTLEDAGTQLSRLLDMAAAGEEVEITRQGVKMGVFRLVAADEPSKQRRPGAMKGEFTVPDDCDDEDLELTVLFHGVRLDRSFSTPTRCSGG